MAETEQKIVEPGAARRGRHHGSRGAKRAGHVSGHAKKKSGIPVGMIVMAAAGLLFVCYLTDAGNVQTTVDAFFNAQVHSAHTHDAFVSSWFTVLLPYVAMALCLCVLYVLLASMGVGRTKRKPAPVTESMTVHEFAETAAAAGVGPRVAREMYRMLLPEWGRTMRSTVTKPFAERGLSSEAVWGMFEELTAKSGGVVRGRVGVEALGTPMEMMQAAEGCVERAALERRAVLQKAAATLAETHRTVVPVSASGQR